MEQLWGESATSFLSLCELGLFSCFYSGVLTDHEQKTLYTLPKGMSVCGKWVVSSEALCEVFHLP